MHGAEQTSLKKTCLQVVRKHFAALDTEHVLDLPAALIEELLPQLTVCQLDELQPGLNQRGISTHCGWAGILKDICGPNYAVDLFTEDEAKHEVMRVLFTPLFYGLTNNFVQKNITNLNTLSFMLAAAKYIKHFSLYPSLHNPLRGLISEQQRPLLNLLEKQIESVGVLKSIDLSKRKTQTALYILHRLLDHGVAKKIVVDVQCPIVLAWLLHGRGSQYEHPELKNLMLSKKGSFDGDLQAASASADVASCSAGLETRASEDDQVIPCKRSKLDFVSSEEESGKANFTVHPQVHFPTFPMCDYPLEGACPRGQIECLEVRRCGSFSLRVLKSSLPTFYCLRSLTLNSSAIFGGSDLLDLARGLKRLSESSRCSLTHLSVAFLPCTRFMEVLLDAVPEVTSLHVEILSMMWGSYPQAAKSDVPELPLQKLKIRITEFQTDLNFITSVLSCAPHLTSLHITGINIPTGCSVSQLLTTLSESNRCLRSLNLEDSNLSDCLPDILNLLRNCQLEELWFNDCRLLEKCSDKEEALQQLVSALKMVPSLHTLGLAQNRLTKNVCVLSELFSGSSPSSVKHLNISSNFIQPAELLEFAHRLRTHRPPQRLTLDLRMNPGDRDPDTWNAALNLLRPLCVLLMERWKSTDTMVDHISNM
nr:PREDICTED: leucine-rich repeat-containing protein 41 [Paralichthys olivaceus]